MQQRKLDEEKERLGELDKKVEDLVETASLGSLELQQVEKRIATKTAELECPVCLNTCSPPIYTCPNQHLVCSTCRPHLATCPECRVTYGGQMRVHRYAERDAREVEEMRSEVTTLRKSLYGRAQENAQVKAEENMHTEEKVRCTLCHAILKHDRKVLLAHARKNHSTHTKKKAGPVQFVEC